MNTPSNDTIQYVQFQPPPKTTLYFNFNTFEAPIRIGSVTARFKHDGTLRGVLVGLPMLSATSCHSSSGFTQ